MISDSDRREVARRLRDGGSVHGAGDFFDAVAFSLPPLPGKTNLTTNPTDLLHQLADLIDRPTCHVVKFERAAFISDGVAHRVFELRCSNCGEEPWSDAESVTRFCPHCRKIAEREKYARYRNKRKANCGAEVVE